MVLPMVECIRNWPKFLNQEIVIFSDQAKVLRAPLVFRTFHSINEIKCSDPLIKTARENAEKV